MTEILPKPQPQHAVPRCTHCGWPLIFRAAHCAHHAALCDDCAEPTPAQVERVRDLLVSRHMTTLEDL